MVIGAKVKVDSLFGDSPSPEGVDPEDLVPPGDVEAVPSGSRPERLPVQGGVLRVRNEAYLFHHRNVLSFSDPLIQVLPSPFFGYTIILTIGSVPIQLTRSGSKVHRVSILLLHLG